MTDLRDARLRELAQGAPRPPAGRRPQAGVVDGCGDWACPHCYEADGPPIGERQVTPETGEPNVPRCRSCGQPYPVAEAEKGEQYCCAECEAYARAYRAAYAQARGGEEA